MEVEDGFILGIYNYCDRWCETCAFTSRCRVFADCAEMQAQHDPNMKAIADAPPLPQDIPPPRWMQELIDEMNKVAAEPISDEEYKALCPFLAYADHDPDWPADHDGSAKVALLGIERSHAAGLDLVHRGLATPAEIEPVVTDLIWLCDELERVFPQARAFVRPGFDEPDEVARLNVLPT